jgi:NitT/TauT family transport system substrate-binding protein
VTAALAAGAAACGGSSSGGGGTLTIGIPPVISGADIFVAQQQGYFAAHHLKVDVKELNGGAAIVPALESGSVQVGETNVVSVIQGAAHGISEPCFAGANTDPKDGAYLSLVAGVKAGVRDAAGLKGKTVAVNAVDGVNQLLVSAYLSAHGVNPSSVHFIALQYPDMPGALSAGRVDAAVTSEPFTTISRGRGNALLAGTPLQYVDGQPTYSCWNASASWLSSHKTEPREFAAAMDQADAWITAHPAGFRKVAAAHLKISSAVLDRITLPVFTGALSAGDISDWESAAQRYGLISSRPASAKVLVQP